MSIATFADVKAQIGARLNRSNLTAQYPIWIQAAETRIYYGSMEPNYVSEPLRVRAMENSDYATVTTQKVPLPTGYLAQRRFYINTNPVGELKFITPDVFWRTYPSSVTGQPKQFTIEGENLVLGPAPGGSYDARLLFYARFTALSGDTDTNWLLVNAPGAYVEGALIEAYRYSRNFEAAQQCVNAFCGIINSLNNADKADRYSSPWTETGDTGNP